MFDASNGQVVHQFLSMNLKSLCPINSFHPSVPVLACGNRLGRVHVFRPPRWSWVWGFSWFYVFFVFHSQFSHFFCSLSPRKVIFFIDFSCASKHRSSEHDHFLNFILIYWITRKRAKIKIAIKLTWLKCFDAELVQSISSGINISNGVESEQVPPEMTFIRSRLSFTSHCKWQSHSIGSFEIEIQHK